MTENSEIIVPLPEAWLDVSKRNSNGPSTYVRKEFKSNLKNHLQFSLTNYGSGKIPNPSKKDLVTLARNSGLKANFGEITKINSGTCKFGIFGTAIFRSMENPITQVWYLSNGKDFILASYICQEAPRIFELQEVENIVLNAYTEI
jgi:hypothetical protein